MKTKTIFRKFKTGEIIALFPEELGDNKPHLTCLSYMNIGRHSAASVDLVRETLPASAREYADLKKELNRIGYEVEPVKRMRRSFLLVRLSEYKRETGGQS